MKKVTVFEGTINGVKFDNVSDYNKRMTELLESGATDIQASSSTSIKTVEDDECSGCDATMRDIEVDEDLTCYPYFEDECAKYLDILVTTDTVTNGEAREEMHAQLNKCYNYIVEELKYANLDDKHDYLLDIQAIIAGIKEDNKTNNRVDAALNDRVGKAQQKLELAKAEYTAVVNELKNEKIVVDAAKHIIADMLDFYNGIETETIESIKNHETKDAKHKCSCTDKCNTGKEIDIETTIKESTPQLVAGLEALLKDVFGEKIYFTNVKGIK